jgi:hypothetical protein
MSTVNDFRWSALDHVTIERKLSALKKEIAHEIKSGDKLTPIGESENIGTFRSARLFHSFEVIQNERADEWVNRVYTIYCNQWAAQGGEKTPEFIRGVWSNALYHFIMDEILSFLRLAFAIDERAIKLLDHTYSNLPQGVEANRRISSVNRIYSDVLKLWGEKKIPAEASALKVFIAKPPFDASRPIFPPVEPLSAAPATSRQTGSTYLRTKEKDLKNGLRQDPANALLQQQLMEELSRQQRLAQELVDLQGPELAISVFGRTDLEIAEEIKSLRISMIISKGSPEPDGMTVEEVIPVFKHSETYESIIFNGENYTLQERQAAVVKMLHEALQKGHPAVSMRKILSIPGCEAVSSVRDIFKSRSQLWGTLITNCEESGEGRGFYRLHPSIKV